MKTICTKRSLPGFLLLLLLSCITLTAQSGNINGGFYFKLGPSIPMGKYKSVQKIINHDTSILYAPSKLGGALDLGFIIYIGPAFAKKMVRAGIDVTFLSFNFNPVTRTDSMSGNSYEKYEYWYLYVGQKIGPVITINPVGRLMLDLSYKLNAYIAFNKHLVDNEFKTEWGYNMFANEVSLGIRYSVLVVSFQYNFGHIIFNNFDKSNPSHDVQNNTFRLLLGLKF